MQKLVIGLSLMFTCFFVQAKTKCDAQVNFDIYVTKNNIKIINNMKNFTVSREGNITLDNVELAVAPNTRQRAIHFQENVRKTLPNIEHRTYQHLDDLRAHFNSAIKNKVGNDSSLLKHLDSIYNKLTLLLKSAINTQSGVTEFHHQAFNNITDEGQKIAKQEFFGILKDSVKEFKLFKNFSTLKGVAKTEWRQKKPELKAFNEQVCEVMKNLVEEQNTLLNQLQSNKWLQQ